MTIDEVYGSSGIELNLFYQMHLFIDSRLNEDLDHWPTAQFSLSLFSPHCVCFQKTGLAAVRGVTSKDQKKKMLDKNNRKNWTFRTGLLLQSVTLCEISGTSGMRDRTRWAFPTRCRCPSSKYSAIVRGPWRSALPQVPNPAHSCSMRSTPNFKPPFSFTRRKLKMNRSVNIHRFVAET